MQEATLQILETVGVKFPSEKALAIFADHGAQVDQQSQIVRIPRDLVFKAMSTVPRYFDVGARDPACDFHLARGRHLLYHRRLWRGDHRRRDAPAPPLVQGGRGPYGPRG